MLEKLKTKMFGKKLLVIFGVFLLVICMFCLYICYQRKPKKYVQYKTRTIDEISENIFNDDNLLIVMNNLEYNYDINGKCFMEQNNDYVECDYVNDYPIYYGGTIFNKEAKEKELVFYPTVDSVEITHATADGIYYSRGGKEYKHSYVWLSDGACKYYPYDVWSTTCSREEIELAEGVIVSYYDKIVGFGLNETEAFKFFRWFYDELQKK